MEITEVCDHVNEPIVDSIAGYMEDKATSTEDLVDESGVLHNILATTKTNDNILHSMDGMVANLDKVIKFIENMQKHMEEQNKNMQKHMEEQDKNLDKIISSIRIVQLYVCRESVASMLEKIDYNEKAYPTDYNDDVENPPSDENTTNNDSLLGRKNRKASSPESVVGDVIMNLSEEDDKVPMDKKESSTGKTLFNDFKLPSKCNNGESSLRGKVSLFHKLSQNDALILQSKYKTDPPRKLTLGVSAALLENNDEKKRFQGLSPAGRPMKIPKLEKESKKTASKNSSAKKTMARKPPGNAIPKIIQCKFHPTPDMGLTDDQVAVCAYVFSPKNNASEVILKVGNIVATRKDFDCLCPGRLVQDKIITFMAMKCMWLQHNISAQTTWSLPPSFAEDVLQDQGVDELISVYGRDWMPTFPCLKYIYIPIKDIGGHWYLAVVSIDDQLIYWFDTFKHGAQVSRRKAAITAVCEALEQMMSSNHYPENFLNGSTNVGEWEIKEPKGLPNRENSENSALWVINWMQMEYGFQTNVINVLKDKQLRMSVALEILLGDHNEKKKILQARAEKFWNTIPISGATC